MVWQKVVGYAVDKNALLLEARSGKQYWIRLLAWADPERVARKIKRWFADNGRAHGTTLYSSQPGDIWINVDFNEKRIIAVKLPGE